MLAAVQAATPSPDANAATAAASQPHLYVFGDFNFRLHLGDVVQHLAITCGATSKHASAAGDGALSELTLHRGDAPLLSVTKKKCGAVLGWGSEPPVRSLLLARPVQVFV